VPGIFTLVARLGAGGAREMWDVFNMGCGFVCVVSEDRADDAVALLDTHHPGAARIGTVTDRAGAIDYPV
jgi:phosphoribosylformylglycinamidine cyclo-ligase